MPQHLLDLHHRHRSPWPASSRWPASGRRTRSWPAPTAERLRRLHVHAGHGLIGAFMTAAYMTRCVYLTFFGEYRRPRPHPHESAQRITVPLIILAVPRGRRRLRQPARHRRPLVPEASRCASSTTSSRPAGYFPRACTAFTTPSSHWRSSPSAVGARSASALGVPLLLVKGRGPHGAHRAQHASPAAGYTLLENKYYLDHLYTGVIVGGDQGPDRPGRVLVQPERASTASSTASAPAPRRRRAASTTYIDQGVVDGVVNGIGRRAPRAAASSSASIQTGKVQQYGALLLRRRRRPGRRLRRHRQSEDDRGRPS